MRSQHDIVEAAVAWRQQIHRRPELGFGEDETAALVAEVLIDIGLDVVVGVGGTGVVGSASAGRSDRAIGLRADMDAIPIEEQGDAPHRSEHPGVFHGCGHDGHTAMLLGAAELLVADPDFDGTVHFIFQPCEETGLGAQAMIDDGLFERFEMEAVYGLHNMPGIAAGDFAVRSGPMMAFEDNFEIVVKGQGGHASMPDRTVDAILIGSEIVATLQSIVARSLSALDTGVVSVTEFETDGARNVIASTVMIRGDCRGFTDSVSQRIERRMGEIVAGVGAAHGAEVSLSYTREFIVLCNTEPEARAVVDAAQAVVGADHVDESTPPVPASEDFARMLAVKPGCYALIGNGIDGTVHSGSLHNPHYDFNDEIIANGIDYWVALIRRQLPVAQQRL